MRYLFVVLAVIVGCALLIKLDTGTLDPVQLAGIGIILLGVAIVSPPTWPSLPAA